MDLFYFVLLWWGHPSIIFGLLFIQEIPGFKQIQGLESEKRQGLFNHGNSNQPFISENQSFVFACEGSFCISVRTPVALATSWLIYYWPSSLQVIHFDWYSKFTTVHGKMPWFFGSENHLAWSLQNHIFSTVIRESLKMTSPDMNKYCNTFLRLLCYFCWCVSQSSLVM